MRSSDAPPSPNSPPLPSFPAVAYLNYGPFSSYAPAYDSSFASISKEDSDLIYSFYGEESNSQGSDRYVWLRAPAMGLAVVVHGLWSNTRRLCEVISEGLDIKGQPVVFGHPDVWQ